MARSQWSAIVQRGWWAWRIHQVCSGVVVEQIWSTHILTMLGVVAALLVVCFVASMP